MKQVQHYSIITVSATCMLWLRIADKPAKSCKRYVPVGYIELIKEQTYFITQPCNYKLR